MSQTSNNLAFAEASSDAAVAEAIHPRGFPESALHDAPVKSKEQVSIDPGTIMLTKRNGEKELSDPLKLIKWGEFGRDFVKNRNVDFTRIMRDTLQGMRDGMTTTELHLSMIRHTLDGGDDAHNKMAGVLYAPHLHKEIHKDGMPTVYELQKKLRMLGLMRKLDYTKQEYEEIEKIIDHRRDYGYAHFQLEQLVRKYAVQDRVKRIIYETPQYTFMRMAMAVFSKAKKLGRIDHIREFYTLLAENVINAPTPNYVYLGTNLNGLISCCLIHSGDSIGSLNTSDVVAYRMTANGSGIGVFQGQRGIGDPVRNGALEHNGKLPYGNATGKLVRANMQAGRAGAAKIEVNIFDREAVQTAQMQNPRTPAAKRNRDLHAAIQYHGFFLNKAAVDAEIFTFSCKTAPDLFEAFYGKDRELFEKLYAKYENDPTWVKSWVRARDLLVTVGRESYNVGTVYGFIADNVNYNTPFKEPIYCSNLCVAPETMLMTDKGEFEIATLVGQQVNVWNGEEWSGTTVVKTGTNQKLMTVATSDGRHLECTPYHKWYIVEGYGKPAREVRTHELQPGDRLIKFDAPIIDGTEGLTNAYASGFASGDGTVLPNGQTRVYLYGEKKALRDRFDANIKWSDNGNRLNGIVPDVMSKFDVPSAKHTMASRLAWLAGWLDADGTVSNNLKNQSLSGCSTNFDFLKRVQAMLQISGIHSKITQAYGGGAEMLPKNDGSGNYQAYETKPRWRLHISSVETQKLLAMGIDFGRLKVERAQPQRTALHFVTVTDVIDTGRTDDTYCVTEPKRHMAVFNGILTGQCMEILQPIAPYNDLPDLYENDYIGDIIFLDEEGLPYTKAQRLRFEIKGDPDKREYAFADLEEGMVIRTFGTDEAFITVKEITYRHRQPETSLCALGGIVVYNVRDDAHYDRAMYYTQRMIDYCIDQNDYPFPQIKFTSQNRRNAGIGLLGAATVLARKNLRYNDRAGLEEIHRMAERHMFFAIKNSIDLGEEFGNAGWINKTRWPEGWLPIDTASPYIDEICNPGLQYDWEMLRRRLIKNKGMRFSCLVAHMPTESSSKAAGAPNGWYPVRELSMAKSDSTNVIEWTAPESDLIGQNYQSAWTITPEDMIRVYAVIQKFTDQGISADIFLDRSKDTELSAVALIKRINMMKKYGLKTHYYFNTKTSMDAFGAGAGGGGAKCGSGGCVL